MYIRAGNSIKKNIFTFSHLWVAPLQVWEKYICYYHQNDSKMRPSFLYCWRYHCSSLAVFQEVCLCSSKRKSLHGSILLGPFFKTDACPFHYNWVMPSLALTIHPSCSTSKWISIKLGCEPSLRDEEGLKFPENSNLRWASGQKPTDTASISRRSGKITQA